MTSVPRESNVERLRTWAATLGMTVRTSTATQREPDYVVAVVETPAGGESWGPTIISRSSLDSAEAAATYLINALARLGVEIPQ